MTPPEILIKRHNDLCDEVHQVLHEENRILRSTGKPPDETFLEKKRNLLPLLDESVEALKKLRSAGEPKTSRGRELVESGQKKMMKLFLLDRENEQLLLKATAAASRPNPAGNSPQQGLRRGPPSFKNVYNRFQKDNSNRT